MIQAGWYKAVTDLINYSQVRRTDIMFPLNDMAAHLNMNEVSDSDITKKQFYNTIIAKRIDFRNIYNEYSYEILGFVKALQVYVNDRYTSIDDFLSDNNIKVLSIFANISAEVGFTIDDDNIIVEPVL